MAFLLSSKDVESFDDLELRKAPKFSDNFHSFRKQKYQPYVLNGEDEVVQRPSLEIADTLFPLVVDDLISLSLGNIRTTDHAESQTQNQLAKTVGDAQYAALAQPGQTPAATRSTMAAADAAAALEAKLASGGDKKSGAVAAVVANWLPAYTVGAFFNRYVTQKNGKITIERVRVWCGEDRIMWCDAKLPFNEQNDSRIIKLSQLTDMFCGTVYKGKVYFHETVADGCAFSLRTRHHSLHLETGTTVDCRNWWSEIRRIIKAYGITHQATKGASRAPSRAGSRAPSQAGSRAPSPEREEKEKQEEEVKKPSENLAATMMAKVAAGGSSNLGEESKADDIRIAKEEVITQYTAEEMRRGSFFISMYIELDEFNTAHLRKRPLILFWRKDSKHPPPGAVYWCDQSESASGDYPTSQERRFDVKDFVGAKLSKEGVPELDNPQTSDFKDKGCATFEFTNGKLFLCGTDTNVAMWINALQSLYMGKEATDEEKRELATRRKEQTVMKKKEVERKAAEVFAEKAGFEEPDDLEGDGWLDRIAKKREELQKEMDKKMKEWLPPMFKKVREEEKKFRRELEEDKWHREAPKTKSQMDENDNWYQAVLDFKYMVRSCAVLTEEEMIASKKYKSAVSKDEYSEKAVREPMAGATPNLKLKQDEFVSVESTEYAPSIFARLRRFHGVSVQDYVEAICKPETMIQVMFAGSSTHTFFWLSPCREFIIKGISPKKADVLVNNLRSYYEHVTNQDFETLLPKILGFYALRNAFWDEFHHVIVMKNVFHSENPIHQIFELKGSSTGRNSSKAEKKQSVHWMKDNDWDKRDMDLFMKPNQVRLMLDALKRDVRLLAKWNVMGYYLAVGIHKRSKPDKEGEVRNLISHFVGKRDRDNELFAFQTGKVTKDEHGIPEPSALKELKVSKAGDRRLLSITSMDTGGLASSGWDTRRRRFFADENIYYISFMGIFEEFDRKKSWGNWWNAEDFGRTCMEPKPYMTRFYKKYMQNFVLIDEDFDLRKLQERRDAKKEKEAEKAAALAAAGK